MIKAPLSPAKPSHLGEVVRVLRECAGLIRQDLADAVGLSASTIRNIETGRHRGTSWTFARLLAHQCMADLRKLAAEHDLMVPAGKPRHRASPSPKQNPG